jgi:acetylglutamate kinase
VGLTGLDAGLVDAEVLNPELGQVGKPVRSDARLLDLLTGDSFLPVVACVAGDASGAVYNVNGDQMAVACAASFSAQSLVFLTDVDGVRGKDGNICPVLTCDQARMLIREGIASGGMQAKLQAAMDALSQGVDQVLIAPGALAGVVGQLLDGQSVGTRLIF